MNHPMMGSVNAWQRDMKSYLKLVTQGSTLHGPEVNNPIQKSYPLAIYAVHLPCGEVKLLQREQEICDFINEQRRKGFPLDVNPKWGWDITEEGELHISEHRFDWPAVHSDLADQYGILASQEDSLEKMFANSGLVYTQENETRLMQYHRDRTKGFAQAKDFVQEPVLEWLEGRERNLSSIHPNRSI